VPNGRENWTDARLDDLSNRVTELDHRLTARIDSLESRMDGRFNSLDGRIDGLQRTMIVSTTSILLVFASQVFFG
jgi:hypothetical protein